MFRRSSSRVPLVSTLAFAIILTALAAGSSRWAREESCTRLVIASSQEKEKMLEGFRDAYNSGHHVVLGRCAMVTVQLVTSGDAERRLETPGVWTKDYPDVWSPASSAWLNLLRQRSTAGRALLPAAPPDSLFQSPLVIAIPQAKAEALGYPGTAIGWSDVLALVNGPGWAARGQPQWGAFKLGKTNPTVSTSGLHALIGTYLAAGADLSNESSISDPNHASFVAGIEAGVDHYGPTASDFLRNLLEADARGEGLTYLSAVALEEKELVDYNRGIVAASPDASGGGSQRTPLPPLTQLVPIYPKEGTLVADHPYVVLTSSRHRAQALDFLEFMREPNQVTTIDSAGFRDRSGGAGPVLAGQPFVQAKQPTIVVEPPPGGVIPAMLAAWRAFRKPAHVLILVDASAKDGPAAARKLAAAASGFSERDQVGVWSFPAPRSSALPYTVLRPVSAGTAQLVTTLRGVNPVAGSGELEAVLAAARNQMAGAYDPQAVDAIVVLEMMPPKAPRVDFLLTLRSQPADRFVRVFTIGPADSSSLQKIALAGHGDAYKSDSAEQLLSDVISNF